MLNRAELKAKAKAAFKANYVACVLVALIGTLILGGTTSAASSTSTSTAGVSTENLSSAELTTLLIIVLVFMIIAVALSTFIKSPFEIGEAAFFLHNSDDKNAKIDDILWGFRHNYLHNVGVVFIKNLLIGIGCLIFVIPGLVLSYSYRLVPYIVAENPDMDGADVRKLSSDLMRGNKWSAFVFDLSFIGWRILSAVTCGLIEILWTSPYKEAADAELYKALSRKTDTF